MSVRPKFQKCIFEYTFGTRCISVSFSKSGNLWNIIAASGSRSMNIEKQTSQIGTKWAPNMTRGAEFALLAATIWNEQESNNADATAIS